MGNLEDGGVDSAKLFPHEAQDCHVIISSSPHLVATIYHIDTISIPYRYHINIISTSYQHPVHINNINRLDFFELLSLFYNNVPTELPSTPRRNTLISYLVFSNCAA